ncbi:glycosyltransferase [Chromatocurvus halotolerans]|uniref:Glycosyltransferase 2-like domain-containing protein n=1 Tax=Chromatocurvus halotolerans TaxID=1132028 RepID=A0A4R2KNY4_9GAMM|nr:glycosyltransferase family 2 protein [Chromatocurvus halotolerans]TCO74307.1 hypothetical protein EV688_11420 [Chromatocurvus halotolerans]
MKISILFATHNGAKTLPYMLESLSEINCPYEWELLAVNNESSDETEAILQSYIGELPIRILNQPKRGKNRSLNLGLKEATGDLIVLTDDDVVPNEDWIVRLVDCAEANPKFDIFAGRIGPLWPCQPDPVIIRNVPLGTTYAISPTTLNEGPINPGNVWGPNMAIRRRVFDAGHTFNEHVGPDKGRYIMGSETEFTERLHVAGYKCWFCDAAVVKHIIRENQMTQSWVIDRAFRSGRGERVRAKDDEFAVPSFIGIPRWRIRVLLRSYYLSAFHLLTGDTDARFAARWEISFLHGYINESLKVKLRGEQSLKADGK